MASKKHLNKLIQLFNNEEAALKNLNANVDILNDVIDDYVSRSGLVPTQMLTTLDMGSKRIINVGAPVDDLDVVRYKDVKDAIAALANIERYAQDAENAAVRAAASATAADISKRLVQDMYDALYNNPVLTTIYADLIQADPDDSILISIYNALPEIDWLYNNHEKILLNNATGTNSLSILGADVTASNSIAIGVGANVTASNGIQIGAGTNTVSKSMNVALDSQHNYTLLKEGGIVPEERLSEVIIKGATDPTTSTQGAVGLLYKNTTTGRLYICVDVIGSDYYWEEVGTGSGGGTAEVYTSPAMTASSGVCEWTITHTMNSRDIVVAVYNTTTYEEPFVTIARPTTSTVKITFYVSSANIPAGAYKAVLVASSAYGSGDSHQAIARCEDVSLNSLANGDVLVYNSQTDMWENSTRLVTLESSVSSLNGAAAKTASDNTFSGANTFSSTITGNISGNAGTVTNGVYTIGDQDIGGIKTFTAQMTNYKDSSINTDTNPASDTYKYVALLRDSNDETMSFLRQGYFPEGTVFFGIGAAIGSGASKKTASFNIGVNRAGLGQVSASADIKAAIVDWGMPDWSSAIQISFPYTAPSNGYILRNVLQSGYCHLNIGNTGLKSFAGAYGNDTSIILPVEKGNEFTIDSSAGTWYAYFVPSIGG